MLGGATEWLWVGELMQEVLAATELRFPDDVSLIGYDNNRAAWDSAVPISTLAQLGNEMGKVAMRLLLEEIGDEVSHRHQHVVLEPTRHRPSEQRGHHP